MIDTDKYVGHTSAKGWRKADGSAMSIQSANNNADAELMADAPLLLAEVKRLREQIVDMIDSMDNYYIRDIQHATDFLRDMIGYYEDEEE